MIVRHQLLPRTAQPELNSNDGGQQNIELTRLDFLQVSGADFRQFRQILLCQFFGAPFPAHVCPERFQPGLFFSAHWHDTLHRVHANKMNVAMDRERIADCEQLSIAFSAFPVSIRLLKETRSKKGAI